MRGNTACGRLGKRGVVEHSKTDPMALHGSIYQGSFGIP